MKNYTLQRFVKLNLYFFGMYGLLTAAWYGLSGRFGEDAGTAIQEILSNAAIFSLMFTTALLVWYRRTELRIPVKTISQSGLEDKLETLGYERIPAPNKGAAQVYKPRPPKAPVLAGKIFVLKSTKFYHVRGPLRKLESLEV
ncbi:hypothetical protein H9Q13_01400 [Pontibacter sp. JH31]|uniref:Poly-beta-1,6-N-acetyl-D-glucosamine biosynthesis protein PgaD n=1 Tax=Pontibacter aquaedesilientis TaxID=2766980 RepID=A0ABR7XD33_9BACT|nr:hypothetical protein [Pontibacter aquaedesilientis]MBD1395806.1 hypothetical protein [Pontibacter aquaedesilientis]